jgi:hypothetical protein
MAARQVVAGMFGVSGVEVAAAEEVGFLGFLLLMERWRGWEASFGGEYSAGVPGLRRRAAAEVAAGIGFRGGQKRQR